MNRPQIINPNTGKIINLFSRDIEELLDDGYTIDDILSYPILPVSKNIPLTGYKDLDTEILLNLDIDHLSSICSINKYTKNICSDKSFWIKKFNKNNIEIPKLDTDNINWLHLYKISSSVKHDIMFMRNLGSVIYKIIKRFYVYDLNEYLNMMNHESIGTKNMAMKIKNIYCYKVQDEYQEEYQNEEDNYDDEENENNDDNDDYIFLLQNRSKDLSVKMNRETLYLILCYLKYFDIIKDQDFHYNY
jgi:hypothetical protein